MDFEVGGVYEGQYFSMTRNGVTSRREIVDLDTSNVWYVSSTKPTDHVIRVCSRASFKRWARRDLVVDRAPKPPPDFLDEPSAGLANKTYPLPVVAEPPPSNSCDSFNFGPAGSGSATTFSISQDAPVEFTPWYLIKVGEVVTCEDGRLFLAVEGENRDDLSRPDALALLDLRTLEILRKYETCSALKLRRVSARISIDVG